MARLVSLSIGKLWAQFQLGRLFSMGFKFRSNSGELWYSKLRSIPFRMSRFLCEALLENPTKYSLRNED